MRVPRQFNIKTVEIDRKWPRWLAQVVEQINRELQKLSRILPGPKFLDYGDSGSAITVKPTEADIIRVTLSAATPAITLAVGDHARAGDSGTIELVQDATGNRVPSWVNATGGGGSIAAPATGATKKTMYEARYNGTHWVLAVHASNY